MLSGQQTVAGRAGTEPRSILEAHPQGIELFCIRISAFSGLCSGLYGRLNGLGPFFINSFDQSGFVSSIYLRPSERGDEFGMGKGLIHKDHAQGKIRRKSAIDNGVQVLRYSRNGG